MTGKEPTKESQIQNPREREEVHEAAHDLGEIRKQQMARGEVFTQEHNTNPSNPNERSNGDQPKNH